MIGIGIVNHVHLGAANPARKARPCGAGLAQPQTGGIDQIDALAERPAQTAMRPFHQLRKQVGKHGAGPSGIGRPVLSLYDLGKRKVNVLGELDTVPFWLGASKDAERVVFDQPGWEQAQIMLVENFR